MMYFATFDAALPEGSAGELQRKGGTTNANLFYSNLVFFPTINECSVKSVVSILLVVKGLR